MNIFPATQKGPLLMPGYIDPNDRTLVTIHWGAPVFQVNKIYRKESICRPTVDNGYYYECITNGKSAATEPTIWGQVSQTTGTVLFSAVPYDLFILPGETVTASSWSIIEPAPLFQVNKTYILGEECRPTTSNGYYYVCTTPGISGSTEPVSWSLSEQTTGTAVFQAFLYCTITSPTFSSETTTIIISAVSSTITDFTMTNRVTSSTGEIRDRSFKYKVREQ